MTFFDQFMGKAEEEYLDSFKEQEDIPEELKSIIIKSFEKGARSMITSIVMNIHMQKDDGNEFLNKIYNEEMRNMLNEGIVEIKKGE